MAEYRAGRKRVTNSDEIRAGVVLRRHPTARRYLLRLDPEGQVVVTMPLRGSPKEALDLVAKHREWIERQQARRKAQPAYAADWRPGTEILFRGEVVALAVEQARGLPMARVASESFKIADLGMNLRRPVEQWLRRLALAELPPRVKELAERHGVEVGRVSVRNQASRWGSCSATGTISLNWRLIQVPPPVRDYIILHELMHRREMNHSARFWRLVQAVCPDYRASEAWLKAHSRRVGL
jgi:predicted metal-dependent hydrolase